ncbi:29282_t:CDS:2 [Racocetra persica]|uniref:29282_t:CDS:1 n=1 Tax=Racocetra persica TaxID=160502 RepID=A0ACA9M386_9GLOM|nr:29282_t:CDS:2 [Racocetra persica]
MPIRKRKVNKVSQNQKGRATSLVQQKVKPQLSGKFHGSQRLIKKYSFADLERLIKQAQQAKKKGRAKLLANQQKYRLKKQAALRVQQAKAASREQKTQRLKQIYSYFQKELNKQDPKQSPYYSPHLDLPPHLAQEFGSKYTVYKLNKQGSSYLLKQTNQAYQEELTSQSNQIRY